MFRLICLAIGYFIGCLQTAYIVGRITANIDIREHGSGNAGTTNVMRIIGRSAGLIVFITDVAKTILAFTICTLLFKSGSSLNPGVTVLPGLYGGLGVILGHNYPFFMKFKGGKGAASSMALFLCINLPGALISYIIGVFTLLLSRYISLTSLVIISLIPVFLFIFGYPIEVIILGLVVTALCFFQHRENIDRLRKGTERKIRQGKK